MPVNFDPYAPPITGSATLFAVLRYHRANAGGDRFEPLPNVKVESIHWQEGPVPPSAQFSYVLDSTGRYDWPSQPEQLWPLGPSLPYVLQPDDEVIVRAIAPDGSWRTVFDGFVQLPQLDMGPSGVAVHFTAVGVHVRLWDQPVERPAYRDTDDPEGTSRIVAYNLPVWFNPDGVGNCTPAGHDHDEGGPEQHPLFLDEKYPKVADADPETPRLWTLGGFVNYLCWEHNVDEVYVKNPEVPNGLDLDDYLSSIVPKDGLEAFFDPGNPLTFDLKPILLRSFDATGKGWVDAIAEQLGYYGYSVFLHTADDPDDPGAPYNRVVIYRTDGRDGNPPKALYYPEQGASILAGVPAFSTLGLTRDRYSTANEFRVVGTEDEYEISVILAPGFTPSAGDASDPAQFNTSALQDATAEKRKKYRWFVADEAGLGHWDGASWVEGTPLDLKPVFGEDDDDGPQFARRMRPGQHDLISRDASGQPRKAELAISRNYAGAYPEIWDKTGTWQSLGNQGWRLLKDRLGIEIVADNPENWRLPKAGTSAAPGDVVRAVKSWASPDAANPKFFLRLTTVIKADRGVSKLAGRRAASPGQYATRRVIDAKDYWKKQVVHKSSVHNTSGSDRTPRDDGDAAEAHALALRTASETVRVAGHFVVPYVTFAVGIGDFVSGVEGGRTIPFHQMAGSEGGEGVRYPVVVAVSLTCQNPQTTTFKITDRRSEPESVTHGWSRST